VLPGGWLSRVIRAVFVARLKNRVSLLVIVFVIVGLLISGVQVYEMTGCSGKACPLAPGFLDWLSEPRTGKSLAVPVINLGAYVFVAGAGLVVTISRGALKNSAARRAINVVWDIFSFWPHATHPFTPRPYSRWTVVELRNRIVVHLESGRDVVVCAHSQGSVIAFAALLLLTDQQRDRVALLTCGSQLRVIYPRAFPGYFNYRAVAWMFKALGSRWINLYRWTDPLAGPVLSWRHRDGESRHFPLAVDNESVADCWPPDEDRTRKSGNDWLLIDPVPYDAAVETGPVYAVHGHHDYWLDPGWKRAITALRPQQPPS
jgi:hypothetical protein